MYINYIPIANWSDVEIFVIHLDGVLQMPYYIIAKQEVIRLCRFTIFKQLCCGVLQRSRWIIFNIHPLRPVITISESGNYSKFSTKELGTCHLVICILIRALSSPFPKILCSLYWDVSRESRKTLTWKLEHLTAARDSTNK